ncbi:MAG: molecular chaperone GrpE [Myxococcota bacterium]|jgi:molecular chaperone GrpE
MRDRTPPWANPAALARELQRLQQVAGSARARSIEAEQTIARLASDVSNTRAARARAEEALAAARYERDALRTERDALREQRDAVETELSERESQREREQQERADLAAALARARATDSRTAELQSDLANLRRHRDQAVARATADGRAEGILELAQVHDDLERALQAYEAAAADAADDAWAEGTRTMLARVRAGLARLGAERLGSPGEAFSPERHEAVGQVPGEEDGVVVAVQQVGFWAAGRLVRPARVVVSRSA